MHSVRLGVAGLIALVFMFAAAAAQAQDRDKQVCGNNSERPEARTDACTRVLARPRLSPHDRAMAHMMRAHVLRNGGNLDGAITDYDQALRFEPPLPPARNGRAYARMQKAKYKYNTDEERALVDAAVADLDIAIRADPQYMAPRVNRTDVYRVRGEIDRAFNEIEQALRVNPRYAPAFFVRAAIWRAKGDMDRAIADYGEALRLNPKYEMALVARGVVHEKKNDYARARSDFQAALNLPLRNDVEKRAAEHAKKRLAAIAAAEQAPASPPSAGQKSTAADRRVALVIGNSTYAAVPALANPRRDAEAIAAGLRRAGFQSVTVHNDLTRDQLLNTLNAFARTAESADWAMVYFAGHGMEIGGTNYLIPTDAKLGTDRSVNFEAVPVEQVMTAVEGAKRLRLVMLDACRDNPFTKQMRRTVATRSIGRGLAAVEPEAGTLVVYAAKHGETALDGEGVNSPFVKAFLKNLATPGIEIRKFFDLVRDDVMEMTNKRQQPFTYGSVPGRQDFFFASR